MGARTLHVRCATWDQVDQFTTRKLRKGKLLSMKVPFIAKVGAEVTIGLELPNEVTIAIDGVIQKAAPVEQNGKVEPGRTWIEIELIGFTDEVKARIKGFRREPEPAPPVIQEPAPTRRSEEPAPARKSDPRPGDELPEDERELFQHLSNELRRLRAAAVHDVLGVPRSPTAEQVRASWKDMIRRYHPDLVSRRNAPAITHLAEELTILGNRAYDRMRASLAGEGIGLLAGSTLASPPGWLVGFEDMPSADGTPMPRRAGKAADRGQPAPEPMSAPAAGQGSDAFEQRARAMLGQGDPNTAREVLAAALVIYPRSKPLRSLYYVATALAALQDGEVMLATAQLETALAHHEQCVEAAKMLDHIKRGTAGADAMKRLFQ